MSAMDMRRLYYDIMRNPGKYKAYAEWLYIGFSKFISQNIQMRIYVGGDKQFLMRGDKQLESSLNRTLEAIDEYIKTGKVTPKRISAVLYYVNKMTK